MTQTSPVGESATERGAMPTLRWMMRLPVFVLKTLTESLSWLTTHSRSALVGVSSNTMLDDIAGRFAVSA